MTDELDNLVAMIRRLKLEEEQLELEKHITQLRAEQSIDEGCVGCAGPCKVVDVAANLQEELDSVMVRLVDSRNHCGYLSSTIEDLKDRNIEDLKELYNIYEAELRGLKADRTSIKSDRDIMFQNYRNTVAKLQDDIRGLEVELYACKEDSEVLGKVVEAIRDLQNLTGMVTTYDMRHIRDMVQDYLNAPEGPPDPPIDDLYKVTVTYAFLEMP